MKKIESLIEKVTTNPSNTLNATSSTNSKHKKKKNKNKNSNKNIPTTQPAQKAPISIPSNA